MIVLYLLETFQTMARKKRKRLLKKLLYKYRLVILNEDTFEERFSLKLNRLNVFVYSGLFALFLVGITTVIIAFTPLREFIPGYSSTELKQRATELAYQSDSIQRVLYLNEQYLNSIKKALIGDIEFQQINRDSIFNEINTSDMTVPPPSQQDSLLRERVAEEDKYNIFETSIGISNALFAPVNGTVTAGFDLANEHYAVDIAVSENTPVKATTDGTVIFAEWTLQTGYVIVIEHQNNLLSVYKHNASLIKKQGDLVKTGEVIATAGETGELATGVHLHFELWSNGYPVNPELFIDFE